MIEYFVSSTFRDMQAERDVLREYVLPKVKRYANERGEDIAFLDLRWGINTDYKDLNENMAKVLSVCLCDIDRCRPHMIILIGDRYGFVPSSEMLHRFLESTVGGEYNETDLLNKSVTEIEIMHGILRHQSILDNVTICIREPLDYQNVPDSIQEVYVASTDAEREQLQKLKETLISNFPDNVIFYSVSWDEVNQCICGLESFTEKITQRLINNIERIVPSQPICEEENHYNLQNAFFATAILRFSGQQNIIEQIREYTIDKEQNLFLLRGSCGMGKSYLCAEIAKLFSSECYVIPVLISYDGYQLGALQLLKQIVWTVESFSGAQKHFNEEEHTYEDWRIEAKRLIQGLSEEKKVLIILDDIDLLYADEHKDVWDYLPFYDYTQVKIIATAQDDYQLPINVMVNYQVAFAQLVPQDEVAIQTSISKNLSIIHKELPTYVIAALLQVAKYHSPYYLEILMYRINHLSESDYININNQYANNSDANENLYRYIEKLIYEIPTTEKLALQYILNNVRKNFSALQIEKLLTWIQLTLRGLRQEDILKLFNSKIGMMEISKFLYMTGIFLRYDDFGRIYFQNSVAKIAIAEYLMAEGVDNASALKELYFYFDSLPDDDFLKLQEYIPLCLQCGYTKSAALYLSRIYIVEQEKEQRSYMSNPKYEMAISSIIGYYNSLRCSNVDLYEFLMKMIDEANNFTHRECWGFVSAILFTYDLLFDFFSDKEKENVMIKLYNTLMSKIYPYYSCNIEYLRTTYICCEQCGIRATDLILRRKMYEEFLQYSLEMLDHVSNEYKYINFIFADISMAFEKNALLTYKSHTSYAMKVFDEAVTAAELISPTALGYDILKARKNEVLLSRASVVIEFEMLLKNSNISQFWDEERLCAVMQDLAMLQIYYESVPSTLNTNRIQQNIYFLLANGSFCFDDFENEYQNLLSMYNISKKICAKSNSIIDLDKIRMSLMRLGGCQNNSITCKQKLKWLAKSMDWSKIIFTECKNDNSLAILFHVANWYLRYAWEYIEHRNLVINDNIVNNKEMDFDIKELSAFILIINEQFTAENMKLILRAPVDDDEKDNFYKLFMKFLSLVNKYQEYMRVLSISTYQKSDYKTAIENGEICLKLCNSQEGLSNTKWLLTKRLDICHFLHTCYHNLILSHSNNVYTYKSSPDLSIMESYYIQCIINNSMLYDCLSLYNDVTQIYKNTLSCYYSNNDDLRHAIAMTNLLCYAIDNPNEGADCKLFWDAIEKKSYYISGQKYHSSYFVITEDESYQQIDDNFRIFPQKIIEKSGRYLCYHINEARILKLLYLSDWFECLALEYAYRHDMQDVAKKILENGYDSYLELPLLYVLRKYNRSEYENQMKELKLTCHLHNVKISKKRLHHIYKRNKYDLFCGEYLDVAKKIINESKFWDKDDSRLKNHRSVITFNC